MTKSRLQKCSVSVKTFLRAFPDERACLEYVFYHRHGFAPLCRKCAQPASFKQIDYRRSFISRCCSAFSSPTAKTILDHTRIPVRMWFYVLLLYTDRATGVSQNELRRLLGIHTSHAYAMADKIRILLALSQPFKKLGGKGVKIYVDETQIWIGPEQRHVSLLAMTDGLRCELRIIPDRRAMTLVPLIAESVERGSTIVSDSYHSYNWLSQWGFEHSRVDHSRFTGAWVNAAGDSTNNVESIWALLKRYLKGKSARMSHKALWKYLAEVMFRYEARSDPAAAWWRLIGSFRTIDPDEVEAVRKRIDRSDFAEEGIRTPGGIAAKRTGLTPDRR